MPNRIKEIRESRGLTQEKLGELIGAAHSTVQRLETGKRKLTEDWMRRIGGALKVQPQELLDSTGAQRGAHDDGGLEIAAKLLRRMTPDQRAQWFQIGDTFVEHAPRRKRAKGGGGARLKKQRA